MAPEKRVFPVTLEEIRSTRDRIKAYIRETPLVPFDYLSREKKKDIFLKCENLQITGSFKIRGAANCILENMEQAKKAGVIAASAGNHAQGVAAICHQLGIKATICMPKQTPPIKLENTRRWGAETVLVGDVYNDSYEHAVKLAQEKGYLFVHPYRDPKIMAGQGTIGLELVEDTLFRDVEAVVIAIGGGGLMTGIAAALRALKPELKIYGVTAKNAPATFKSLQKGKLVEEAVKFTLAEGVATKSTDEAMLASLKASVDDVFSISEESIASAIALMAQHAKMVVEGAGVLSVAAIVEDKIPEKKIVAVLSGGNIDIPALSSVLQRGLVSQGRLIHLNITIIDRPGGLHSVTEVFAETGANIVQIYHQRASLHTDIGEAVVEVDLETRGRQHTEEILAALVNRGYKVERVV
jgi:threonine dehydratase